MQHKRMHGLLAATLTPMRESGDVWLDQITPFAEHLIARGVNGFYVCGSTGEGVSLTSSERKAVAAEFIQASAGRVPVIVQVGHNAIREACELAAHAADAGASGISATCPSYFKITSVDCLVACVSEIAAAAPSLPFYYYHMPSLTGNQLNMLEFLELAAKEIPNLAGLKYTTPEVHTFQELVEFEDRQFEMLWGVDEMLMSAISVGGQAAIGSTYNIAAPLYHRLMTALAEGDMSTARSLQYHAVRMISTLAKLPFHAALKYIVGRQGVALGGCRLPLGNLTLAQSKTLDAALADPLAAEIGLIPTGT